MKRYACRGCGYMLLSPRLCGTCQRKADLEQCTCYDPVSMEYGPNYPCARCRSQEQAS